MTVRQDANLDATRPPRRSRRLDAWVVGLGGFVLAIAAIGMGIGFAHHASKTVLLLPIGAIVGVIAVVGGLRRFEIFVAAALVLRASLDSVKIGHGSGHGTDPASILAVGFLLGAVLWLIAQRLSSDHPIRDVGYSPLVLPLLGLLAAGGLSVLASENHGSSAVQFARVTAAVAMFMILDQLIRRGSDRRIFLAAVYASAIVPLTMGAYQTLSRRGLRHISVYDRVPATFLHPNVFGIYLTFLIVMGVALFPHLNRRWRLPLGLMLAASFVMLIATYTRTAWIASVIALMYVGYLQSRRLLALLIIGIIVLLIAVPSIPSRFSDLSQAQQTNSTAPGNSLIWRVDYWKNAIKFTAGKHITGIGLGEVQDQTNQGKELHNDFLRSFVEEGIVGLVAYLGFIVALAWAAWRRLKETAGKRGLQRGLAVGFAACVLAFVLISSVSNVISQVVLLWYFLGLAAIATSVRVTRAPSDEGVRSSATPA